MSARAFACAGVFVVAISAPTVARADPSSWLAREVVGEACHRAAVHAGLATDITRDLAVRARAAGWLPRVQMRTVRSFGANVTQIDPYTGRETATDGYVLDLRLTFHLDRTVFAPDEIGIARLGMDREARRALLDREVLATLVTLERTRTAPPEDDAAAVAALEARAHLELLLGEDAGRLGRERGR